MKQPKIVNRSLKIEALECRRLLAFNPTADEQEFMQLVNRYRTDPRGEFSRLISSASPLTARDPIVQPDLDFANVNGTVLRNEMLALNPSAPVAWNEAIHNFNEAHNADMISQRRHFHTNSVQRREELMAAGVNFRFANGEVIQSENVFGFGKSTLHTFAAYIIDWQQGGPNGMNPTRGHRTSILNPDFEQAGHALTPFSGTGFGPQVSSQVLANIADPPVMVTGAIFEDKNNSSWYEAGEGLSTVNFVFTGSAGTFSTTGHTTGGYQIELPPGTYSATATGGGMKFPQTMNNIVVGSQNVWKNWIYDPDIVPPDSREANNTTGTATALSGQGETVSGLSIHTISDVDFFRFTSNGTGTGRIEIQFAQANGDLDLQLLGASGNVLATAQSTTNNEVIEHTFTRDVSYFVRVMPKAGARNESYTLTTQLPSSAPPVAMADRANLNGASSILVDVIANDNDPDGDSTQLIPRLSPGSNPAFEVAGNKIRYTPPAGTSGMQRVNYTVVDDQGLESSPAELTVFVVDFSSPTPWLNVDNAFDINGDATVSPIDVLLVVNELNQRDARELPKGPEGADEIFGFVDSSGDGFVSPIDVLLIVNSLNASGEGEALRIGTPESDLQSVDLALTDMFYDLDLHRKHQSTA